MFNNFHEAMNFNQLFLKLNRFICKYNFMFWSNQCGLPLKATHRYDFF